MRAEVLPEFRRFRTLVLNQQTKPVIAVAMFYKSNKCSEQPASKSQVRPFASGFVGILPGAGTNFGSTVSNAR